MGAALAAPIAFAPEEEPLCRISTHLAAFALHSIWKPSQFAPDSSTSCGKSLNPQGISHFFMRNCRLWGESPREISALSALNTMNPMDIAVFILRPHNRASPAQKLRRGRGAEQSAAGSNRGWSTPKSGRVPKINPVWIPRLFVLHSRGDRFLRWSHGRRADTRRWNCSW
jgi:hypothetical protein